MAYEDAEKFGSDVISGEPGCVCGVLPPEVTSIDDPFDGMPTESDPFRGMLAAR